jgi:hypothetical protein
MKPRARLFLIAILWIVGIAIFTFSRQNYESLPFFPATIGRDCAPWDGSAFTVSVPLEGSAISISIYRPPGIRRPVTFSFPDETRRDGIAILRLPRAAPEGLRGKVWFERVEGQEPVAGWFRLTSGRGKPFEGRFVAEWGDQVVYCG